MRETYELDFGTLSESIGEIGNFLYDRKKAEEKREEKRGNKGISDRT